MLIPADRILQSLAGECRRLGSAEGAELMGSSQQAVSLALQLLRGREAGGVQAVHAQIERLVLAVQPLFRVWPPALQKVLESVPGLRDLASLETAWREMLRQVETLALEDQDADRRQLLSRALTAWETADLQGQLAADSAAEVIETRIDSDRMTAYLQDRFKDESIVVTAMRSLMGGFGKQTYLLSVEGQEFFGDYVLRRDAGEPIADNDCHRIHIEYALIRAVRAQGFPAPDALWVDTEHRLLPGGDFLVMRRAPGVPGGSIFAAQGSIPANLSDTLAGILAQLHALPYLPELAQLNESTNQALWQLPLQDCVRHYLESWLELFLRSPHLPSPAVVAQFGWLLGNLPAMPGQPALLHGDIGFHNFLFDEGRLSAVLDWEFPHLGDPAEDLAYVRNTIGGSLDWPAFMAAYRAAGGVEVDEARLHFFQVWGHLRNACASNMGAARFAQGEIEDLKMVILPHAYIPMFLNAAQALIDQGPLQHETRHVG